MSSRTTGAGSDRSPPSVARAFVSLTRFTHSSAASESI